MNPTYRQKGSGFRPAFPEIVENGRWMHTETLYDSNPNEPFGMFFVRMNGFKFRVMVGDGLGWDHVSVSVDGVPRCPTWNEMNAIKNLFFNDDCCVVQFHPPKEVYINNHEYVLHLWHKQGSVTELPPRQCV